MSEKKLNARIVHKHDVEANWLKATNFIPKQGEIIVYDKDASHNYGRIKVGDGETTVSSLPFTTATVLSDAKLYIDEQIESLMDGDFAISNAEYAETAGHATTADSATSAESANIANSATKATQDGSGNVITSTYETKTDAANKLNTAKEYTDSEIQEWVGDTSVTDQINAAMDEMALDIQGQLEDKSSISHTHSLTDDTIVGILTTDKGGTGSNINEFPDGAVLVKQVSSERGVFVDYYSYLPLDKGGTGSDIDLVEAPKNAVIRKNITDEGTQSLYYTVTDNGAFYATEEDGEPCFGTLPIAQGGTGATTADGAIANLGLTVTAAELNHVSGATGNIQGQLDELNSSKANSEHSHDNYVDVSSDQEIGGGKAFVENTAFTTGITIGEAVVTFDNETGSIVFSFPDTATTSE